MLPSHLASSATRPATEDTVPLVASARRCWSLERVQSARNSLGELDPSKPSNDMPSQTHELSPLPHLDAHHPYRDSVYRARLGRSDETYALEVGEKADEVELGLTFSLQTTFIFTFSASTHSASR